MWFEIRRNRNTSSGRAAATPSVIEQAHIPISPTHSQMLRPPTATGQRPRQRRTPAGSVQTRIPNLVGCPDSRNNIPRGSGVGRHYPAASEKV